MVSALSISVSALKAADTRLSVTAGNIANVNNRAALDAEGGYTGYAPRDVVNVSTGSGVRATTRPVDPAYQAVPDGRGGAEARPNVDLADQIVELGTASRAYESATAVIRTADEMQKTLLDVVG